MKNDTQFFEVTKITDKTQSLVDDIIAVEEPLEIKLTFGDTTSRETKNLAITMRTPGKDIDLAIGFLYSEGIITSYSDILEASHCGLKTKTKGYSNSIKVSISPKVNLDFKKLDRHFYTTSSCGVCGKASIELLETKIHNPPIANFPQLNLKTLYQLPKILRENQSIFEDTGGIHASGLFDTNGNLLILKEDVGRHNALDKLIGSALQENMAPLHNYILVLSGRVSFELVQKSLMAGISIIAAVGAPSSIAIELAKKYGLTIIGFLKNQKCNIYSHPERIKS